MFVCVRNVSSGVAHASMNGGYLIIWIRMRIRTPTYGDPTAA